MACILCDQPIDGLVDSHEHVILNALGGRKRIRGVICRTCNVTKGASWDSELARQLRPLALLFGVARQDRQQTPAGRFEASNGRSFWLNADGSMHEAEKPFRKIGQGDGTSRIQIRGDSMHDIRRILKRVAEAYPEIDYEKALASAKSTAEYLDVPLHMTLELGGKLAGRSIVKSAFCLAVASGVKAAHCAQVRAYLSDALAPGPFGYYYARDLVRNRPRDVPLHCVVVSSRETTGQLLGYVEFFGFYRMVVRLADDYQGHAVHASYVVNPMTGMELALEVDLSLSPEEVAACFAYERIPEGCHAAIMDELMPVAQRRAFELERDRVITRAFHHAMKACGVPEGGELPAEKFAEFSRLVAEYMLPFLSRHLRRDYAPPQ